MTEAAVGAVWDTIWLVAQLPGMTESYERLLEYGQIVNCGVPSRAAAVLLLSMIHAASSQGDEMSGHV